MLDFAGLAIGGILSCAANIFTEASKGQLLWTLLKGRCTNFDLLNGLRESYKDAVNNLIKKYKEANDPNNISREEIEKYAEAKTNLIKAEAVKKELQSIVENIFPSKNIKSNEFTDTEILELIKTSNGSEEKKRIIELIEPNLEDAPKELKNSFKDEENGLFSKIIFYFRERVIKRDEKGRSILFYEMLEKLDVKLETINEELDKFNKQIAELDTFKMYENIMNGIKDIIEEESFTILNEIQSAKSEIRKIPKEVVNELEGRGLIVMKEGKKYYPISQFLMADYLSFGREEEPRFFRPYGPMAVDFEKGYVYIRPEVPEIIKQLKGGAVTCIAGDPATGKTVILHSTGYFLLKETNPQVYFIPLKETKRPDKDVICSLPTDAVVILDDCHLNTSYADDLIAPPCPKCSLILSSRPFEPHRFREERIGTGSELFERMKKAIKIRPENTAEGIIGIFSEKQGLPITEETKTQLKEYSTNLMVLSWALEAYKEYESVEQKRIYEVVKNWLCPLYKTNGFYKDLKKEVREKIEQREAAKIFLFLAAFYQYEMPVPRQFLVELLGIEDNYNSELSILLESKIITGDLETIGLPHSAIAKLLVKATKEIKYLKAITETFKSKITINSGNLSWDNGLLFLFFWKYPEKFIYSAGRLPSETFYTIQELPNFPSLLKKYFEEGADFDWLSFRALKFTREIYYDKFEKVKEIPLDKFAEKIKKSENLYSTASLLRILRYEVCLNLYELLKLEPFDFANKIEKCESPFDIAFLLGILSEIMYPKIDELLQLPATLYIEKVKDNEDLHGISYLIETLSNLKYPELDELLNLESSVFVRKIKKNEEPYFINYFLKTLKDVKYPRIYELLKKIEPESLSLVIKNSMDPYEEEMLKTLEILNYPYLKRLKELVG